MPHVIAISNHKGGVGKTASAVNLAYEFAQSGHTILVDMDPQANATEATVGKERPVSILTYARDEIALDDLITRTQWFDVIPSHLSLSDIEIPPYVETDIGEALRELVDRGLSGYDYVIIDTPPSLGKLQYESIRAADRVLIPIQADAYGIDGAYNLDRIMNAANESRDAGKQRVTILGVFLTMYDSRLVVASEMASVVKEEFGDLTFETVVRRNATISQAMLVQQPVRVYAPTSNGAQDYEKLSQEVLQRVRKT